VGEAAHKHDEALYFMTDDQVSLGLQQVNAFQRPCRTSIGYQLKVAHDQGLPVRPSTSSQETAFLWQEYHELTDHQKFVKQRKAWLFLGNAMPCARGLLRSGRTENT